MIFAFLCGLFYGVLVVWNAWTHRENVRKDREFLDTLPPSDDDWYDYWREVWPVDETDTLTVVEDQAEITVNGIPYQLWMERYNGRCTGCCDG